MDAATRRAEEQKSRLEAILLDLSEGVIVCNLEHRILLYNQAAVRILNAHDALGLARSLFGVLTREPVLLTLELLLQQDEGATGNGAAEMIQKEARRFVCTSADLGTFLQAKLSLVREQSGRPSGYVLTFADVSAELESVAQRDALLREVAIEWRRPLASLRAAAEMLADEPQLEANQRRVFQDVVCKEVDALHQRFAEVARCYERLATGPWPLADIYSLDPFRAVRRRLVADRIEVTPVGVPAWMNADSHSLVLALEFLIARSPSIRPGPPSISVPWRETNTSMWRWFGTDRPSPRRSSSLGSRSRSGDGRQPHGSPDRRTARQRAVEPGAAGRTDMPQTAAPVPRTANRSEAVGAGCAKAGTLRFRSVQNPERGG